jgi:hypothetical protein
MKDLNKTRLLFLGGLLLLGLIFLGLIFFGFWFFKTYRWVPCLQYKTYYYYESTQNASFGITTNGDVMVLNNPPIKTFVPESDINKYPEVKSEQRCEIGEYFELITN